MRATASVSMFTALCLLTTAGSAAYASTATPSRATATTTSATYTPSRSSSTATKTTSTSTKTTSTATKAPSRTTASTSTSTSSSTTSTPSRSGSTVTMPTIEITNDSLNTTWGSTTTPSRSTSQTTVSNTSKTLSWNVPSKRVDGSSFYSRELGGYYLTVKNKSTGGTSQIHVSNPDATSYPLKTFRSGSYSFSIQSYDIDGLTSPYSAWVDVTI